MSASFSLYRSEIDGYSNDSFIERIVTGIGHKDRYSTLTALFSPVDAPRTALLNRCRDRSEKIGSTTKMRKLFWLPPFRCWDMLTIGNLSPALLWHIYRTLPQEVLTDEKIIYKLGKISVTLPTLTDGLRRRGTTSAHDAERYTSILNKAFPADRKSSVSSIFSACEQITELSETFRSIGNQITTAGNFDSLVVPVTDIDQCLPEQATSLLFALRNFFCCEYFTFIIATDRDILTNFLISLYDNSLTPNQGHQIVTAIFDDWVYLPPLSIEKMLQSIAVKLDTKEIEYFITLINKSGLLCRFSDSAMMHLCFNRFNSFINNSLDNNSLDDHCVALLLFLFGTYDAESLHSLALLPNLEHIINIVRSNEKSPKDTSSNEVDSTVSSSLVSALPENYKNKLNELPSVYLDLIQKNNNLAADLFSALPASISDSLIAQTVIKIIPFI